jgi:hypothetical protein
MRPVAVDVTPVLTAVVTGTTGVLGGLLGYLGAKHQGSVELERIKVERDRLELELAEPHRQHRHGRRSFRRVQVTHAP